MISVGDLAQLENVAHRGSPGLLKAAGRFVGFGDQERAALGLGAVPWWTWAAIGIAVGFVAGARAQTTWPGKLPAIISGAKP